MTLLAYCLIVLGVQQALKVGSIKSLKVSQSSAAQRILVFDFNHIKEQPREVPPGAKSPEASEENSGGGGQLQLTAQPVPEALQLEPSSMALSDAPDLVPSQPLAPTSTVPHGVSGSGGGTGGGIGTGHGKGVGSGEGEGFKAALPLDSEDVEVEERYKPDYPLMAELQHIEGRVRVRMEVSEKGIPTKVWIVDGDPIFHDNCIRTFKRYRFKNLKNRGITGPVTIEIPVRFMLVRK